MTDQEQEQEQTINGVHCPDFGNGVEPVGATVGFGGVTAIKLRNTFHGDHDINWYDVYKGDIRVMSINAKTVQVVYYQE